MLEFIEDSLLLENLGPISMDFHSVQKRRAYGGMPLKARTAPRPVCQRCCPQYLRFVFQRSMGETPCGANPEPIAAMRPVKWALYRGEFRLASLHQDRRLEPEIDWEPL